MAGPFSLAAESVPGITQVLAGFAQVKADADRAWQMFHVEQRGLCCGRDQAASGGAAQWRATKSPWVGMAATASAIACRI